MVPAVALGTTNESQKEVGDPDSSVFSGGSCRTPEIQADTAASTGSTLTTRRTPRWQGWSCGAPGKDLGNSLEAQVGTCACEYLQDGEGSAFMQWLKQLCGDRTQAPPNAGSITPVWTTR